MFLARCTRWGPYLIYVTRCYHLVGSFYKLIVECTSILFHIFFSIFRKIQTTLFTMPSVHSKERDKSGLEDSTLNVTENERMPNKTPDEKIRIGNICVVIQVNLSDN